MVTKGYLKFLPFYAPFGNLYTPTLSDQPVSNVSGNYGSKLCRYLVKSSNPQFCDFPESGFKVEICWSNPYKIKNER